MVSTKTRVSARIWCYLPNIDLEIRRKLFQRRNNPHIIFMCALYIKHKK